jgi:hypothetical protein
MPRPSRQAVVLAGVSLLAVVGTLMVAASTPRGVDAGFWFEPITPDTLETLPERFGGRITPDEYASADRVQQYYGEMRWDIAKPLLERRVGRAQQGP